MYFIIMENLNENVVLPPSPAENEFKLVNVPIKDENTALNVIISFLSLAQKRGAFGIDESAKIWECIQLFQKPQ